MSLVINNLRKRYGSLEALRGVDLVVESGMFGLLGPNGAGKTTLLRILVGLIQPTSGSVRIMGWDVTREPDKTEMRRHLGYLPQEVGFYPDLTARQFLDYIATLKEMDDAALRRRRVGEVLEMVGLAPVADRKVGGFSGGMKRRLGIAQALLADPRILIVDEPTAGLDPEERIRFRNLLSDLAGDRLVLLSTHIVEDMSQTCWELALLYQGRIRFRGTPGELIERAQGCVWEVEMPLGVRLTSQATVVGTIHLGDRTRYRVVAAAAPAPGAKEVMPTLEDAYMWLMQSEREMEATA
jgi:ABC-2 type transport system ATP-binding protein